MCGWSWTVLLHRFKKNFRSVLSIRYPLFLSIYYVFKPLLFLDQCLVHWLIKWGLDHIQFLPFIYLFFNVECAAWKIGVWLYDCNSPLPSFGQECTDKFFSPFLSRWKWQSRTIKRVELNWYLWVFSKETSRYKSSYPNYKRTLYVYIMILNSIRMGCKTHILHHLIINCHISILLKIQYILPHLITFR